MPNAPALVHEGIAGICGGDHARDEDLDVATTALGHLGAVVRVAEDDMDAVTALSGSGPAYFALLAEAMIEAGLLLGLSRDVSTRLVVQTMFGSARLLRDENMHPVELREAVTSPGGTTTRAIRELERSGVRAAFLNAITAATERSRELADRVAARMSHDVLSAEALAFVDRLHRELNPERERLLAAREARTRRRRSSCARRRTSRSLRRRPTCRTAASRSPDRSTAR